MTDQRTIVRRGRVAPAGSFTNRVRKPAELMLVPMIDIFTVLVTFLLMTAVFSRITILQLDLPSADAGGAPAPPEFRLEVIVRESGFELTNGDDADRGAAEGRRRVRLRRRCRSWRSS